MWFVRRQFRNADGLVDYSDQYRMHDSFSSRSTIHVWEINACQLDWRTLHQFGRENNAVISSIFGTQVGEYQSTIIIYRSSYSSDMCSCRACSTKAQHSTTSPV